ncbi:quinone oxidoreductase family protein [Corynebacterium lubricantis]|uniref:quinone oxidoreductase family protein n=1 Tax=Corynebacterium lubricantis TaxID=541095 RepID=UPI00035F7231|nr:NADP-dependent oxidoreductase [Corynebacterium lubricantis]
MTTNNLSHDENQGSDSRWVATSFDGLDALEFEAFNLPAPADDEVTIRVESAGVNPIDLKILSIVNDPKMLPHPIGNEISGIVEAIGKDAQTGTPGIKVGDEVIAYHTPGGYATRINVPAQDVFSKPESLPFDEAAGLLLVGTTALEMVDRVGVKAGDTVLLHGASGAIGAMVLQFAKGVGATVIGTSSAKNAENVRRFGGIPVEYGPGLADRVRAAAPEGITVALDAAGTEEATETSLEFVSDRNRILTVAAAPGVAEEHGFLRLGGPKSMGFRNAKRAELIELAGAGEIQVPISHRLPLAEAKEGLDLVVNGGSAGKVILNP